MKYTPLALLAAAGLLAGCGGGASSSPLNPANNYGYFRFVNGSADSGSVDLYIDGKLVQSNIGYGQIIAYQKESPGAHTLAVDATGTTTPIAGLGSSALNQSVNAGQYVSLVLVGEQHPTVPGDVPNILAFTDQMYDTPSGGFAADFHDAAAVTGSATTQFSIFTSTAQQNLGSALSVGGSTEPTGIPNTFVGTSGGAVTFKATPSSSSIASATITPSQIDSSGCAANTLPCNTGNLSLYYIDGPGASTAPDTLSTYPAGISAGTMAGFVGTFDANGT
jgi:hypothetical protein